MMDWMKYRPLYLLISLIFIVSGIFGFIKWGFKFGVDFTGGTTLEYRLSNGKTQVVKTGPIDQVKREEIKKGLEESSGGAVEELRFEAVGPMIGPDLIKKTITALVIASTGILFWVALQFKSFKFGVSAVLATLHDFLILFGSFSLLGHFAGAEVDFLFVTAALTILSFSVHDTIVVYDRIRESQKKVGGTLYDLANKAVSETMVRSLNNSFTIIFMLVALILLGGETIRWFAVALLIGTISGTYSSPFVAVPLLVTWEEIVRKFKK